MEIAFLKTFGDRNGREMDLSNFKNRFLNAMDNDLNTAKAIAEIHSLSNHLNRELHYLSLRSLEESFKTLRTFLSILGLFEDWKRIRTLKEEEVEMLVERELARKEGDFEKADEIRKKFRERGLILIDTKWGVRWYE